MILGQGFGTEVAAIYHPSTIHTHWRNANIFTVISLSYSLMCFRSCKEIQARYNHEPRHTVCAGFSL